MTPAEFGNLFTPIYIDEFTNIVELPPEKRPSHLAHYTSLPVLEKIVSTSEIWFSHPSAMNDHEEMWFGIREAVRIMREQSAGSPFTDLAGSVDNFNKIFNQYMEFIRRFDLEVSRDVYVFCLSEYDWEKQPDGLLSMWRGYGANGNGVALVFNTSFLNLQNGSPLLIARVRYGSAEERAEWIKNSFLKCLAILNTNAIHSQTIWMTAWHMFRPTLFHSLSAKHPGFREENEWRIVYLSDLDTQNLLTGQRSYLIRGNTVQPRLKFPIEPLKIEPRQEWTFNSILDRIVLGPTHSSSDFTMSSVRQMLECIGRPEFASKVWASRIPYRPIG
jgi:hypothetical protein